MKEKYINFTVKQRRLIAIILSLSCPFLTLIFCNRYKSTHVLLSLILSFIIALYIFIKKTINLKITKKRFILISFISIYIIKVLSGYNNHNMDLINMVFDKLLHFKIKTIFLSFVVGLCALPVTMYFVSVFLDKIGSKVL